MEIILLRHAKTKGNLSGCYIGRTDEPLCAQGKSDLLAALYPCLTGISHCYSSPLKRCLETAALLCPDVPLTTVADFRESDFGDFEGMNYAQLNGNPNYQAWIDSMGEIPFPNGEPRALFQERCQNAFQAVLADAQEQHCSKIILTVHGGTIMSIMERFALPKQSFYDWQVKNGHGFCCESILQDGIYKLVNCTAL